MPIAAGRRAVVLFDIELPGRRRVGIEWETRLKIPLKRTRKPAGAAGGERCQKPVELGKISCVARAVMV